MSNKLLIWCLHGQGEEGVPWVWGRPQVLLTTPIPALQECFACLLLLLAAESWSWALRGADPLVPERSPAILITGSWWKEVASGVRTCPMLHEKTFEEQQSAPRSRVKVQALDNPLQSTGLCHSSLGFTLFSACSQGGKTLWMQRVGVSQGQVPCRHRLPC